MVFVLQGEVPLIVAGEELVFTTTQGAAKKQEGGEAGREIKFKTKYPTSLSLGRLAELRRVLALLEEDWVHVVVSFRV
ncbi:MAG: hypothetical protein EBZ07_06735 [Verrucomicrobia bacterium]|nr:hypothetical protein [Verrucomicrobiota bacterium]